MEFHLQLFLVVLLLSHSIAFCAYDFLMFAQQWPSTYCTSSTRKTDPCKPAYQHGVTDFLIHGLWPQNRTGSQPRNCVGPNIPEMLSSIPPHLKPDMDSAWPNLRMPPDNDFWQQEWIKHGTCSTLQNTPWDYFALGLQIRKKINLDAILKAAKIVPDDKKFYTKADFNNTIFASLGAYPELMCEARTGPKYYLLEIRVCLDATGASYKNCTNSPNSCGNGNGKGKNNNNGKIIFPV